MTILCDPVAGVVVFPSAAPTNDTWHVYDIALPMSLRDISVSDNAHVTFNDAAALNSASVRACVSLGARLDWNVSTWLCDVTLVVRRGASVDGNRCVVVQRLTVDGDETTLVDNFVVQERVVICASVTRANSVRIQCTAFTRCDAHVLGVIHVTNLLSRIMPRQPLTLYRGPCQYCLSPTGDVYAECGHLFVCQDCMAEHGTERIFNAPCPLCRSVVTTLTKCATSQVPSCTS